MKFPIIQVPVLGSRNKQLGQLNQETGVSSGLVMDPADSILNLHRKAEVDLEPLGNNSQL